MPDYDNSNRVSLWFNDKREKQTHPHLKGQGETSIPVWGSAWFAKDLDPEDAKVLMGIIKRHRESSKLPFISVSMQAKEEKAPSQQGVPPDSGDFDDKIPF